MFMKSSITLLLTLLIIILSSCASIQNSNDTSQEEEIMNEVENNSEEKVDVKKDDENIIENTADTNTHPVTPETTIEDDNGSDDENAEVLQNEYYIEIPQYVQETNYYCAVACLQSVMAYHGLYETQDVLAEELNTHHITGTEYEDLARVATNRIFANGGGQYSYCIPSSDEDRALFEERVIQDMKTSDPVFCSINNAVMYGDVPDVVHEVVLVGVTVEDGHIVKAIFFDPSYSRQDPYYGGLKYCSGDELWNAMINNREPGYVY